MSSGSFASSYVETVRLLDPTCHKIPDLIRPQSTKQRDKIPLFLRNTLTPLPRNNVARYSSDSFYKSAGKDFKFDGTSGESVRFAMKGGGEK
jgi:hypothetical protein